MWKISEIRINNIVSFQEAALTITQGVATLIFGKNEDNASQPCNGSGKSSLIEAISFALTGEQLRRVKTIEEIINDHAEEAYVYLKLENDYDNTSFTIERTISRSASQTIECHKYDGSGVEIERDKTIQPTVLDYNKFILNEIGLSKDDIYNNYILCDNKYESFFDCSDKNKKDIINRFSNGALIDESIAKVQLDMEPIEAKLIEANNKVTSLKGSIAALDYELEQADEKKANAKQEREVQIAKIDSQIQKCREDLENLQSQYKVATERVAQLNELQKQVEQMESSDMTLLESYAQVKQMCQDFSLEMVSDYEALSETYKVRLAEQQATVESLNQEIDNSSKQFESKRAEYNHLLNIYNEHKGQNAKANQEDAAVRDQLNQEIDKLNLKLDEIEAKINKNKVRKAELETMIARNTALLSGAVTCPKCQHKFLIDGQESVDDINQHLSQLRAEMQERKDEVARLLNEFDVIDEQGANQERLVDDIDLKIKARSEELENENANLRTLFNGLDVIESQILSLQRKLSAAENELDRMSGKIDILRTRLFGEITGIIEGRLINGKSFLKQNSGSKVFLEGQMKQYQQSKKQLLESPEQDFVSSLKASLHKYNAELCDAELVASETSVEYDKLKTQEYNFTMFKSYLARKKIDALSLIVNDFLEKIGSDIRLRLEGFSVTKKGKLKDKISVQVMRDGIDCGSYHKFSGGERARLNLACILSLHTLTNSNCEDGKGLDFIIIDELLDKSDEVGMSTYCDALNKLGQTALLITQGGVAENYPHKLLIVKKQGVSKITNDSI